MDRALSVWESEGTRDRFDVMIEDSKERGNYDIILAQIPAMFGDSEKATYLGFRALGLRPGQVLEVMELPKDQLEVWYAELPEMKEFETKHLWDLQRKINADIIRLQFMRNMTMFMLKDSLIIRKGMVDFDGMSPREYNYLRTVRRFYDMGQLLNLEKAIAPEKHRNNSLTLNFGPNQIQVVENDLGEIEVVNEHED